MMFSQDVARMWKQLEDVQLGLHAIIESLVSATVLTADQYEAALQRQRKWAVADDACSPVSFADVIGVPGLSRLIGSHLDGRVARQLRATSQSSRALANAAARSPGTSLLFSDSLAHYGALVDPERGVWQPLPDVPRHELRAGAAVAVFEDDIFVFGGCGHGGWDGCLKTAEWYSHRTGKWAMLPSMAESRSRASAFALGGHVYVCGGCDGYFYLDSVERLNLAAGSWEPGPPLTNKRAKGAVAKAADGGVWLVGGSSAFGALRTAERLDPLGGCWGKMPELLARRAGASAAAVKNSIFVCGGNGGAHRSTNGGLFGRSAEVFDAASGAWQALPLMSKARHFAAAVAVGGSIWVFGGEFGESTTNTPEMLDVERAEWRQLQPLARTSHLAYA